VSKRRLGWQVFGACWLTILFLTIVALALAHATAESIVNLLTIAFWLEVAVLIAAGWLYYRSVMRDTEA
jgi:vacuolar-type H+-ATPase subunit I/STV1